MKKQRLELTWIGKEKRPRLEPRILIEDKELSYHATDAFKASDDLFKEDASRPFHNNLLIHGDNLLALKALEQQYTGKVMCIYIDPPFNTGAAFDNYEDGLEHSVWLDLMSKRLELLHKLLKEEGSIYIHLDDNEVDYLKIILDEIFGRSNFINRITVEARSPSAFSTVNPGVFKSSEYILWYAKDKQKWETKTLRIPTHRDVAYNKFILNKEDNCKKWIIKPLKQAFLENLNQDRLPNLLEFIQKITIECRELLPKEIRKFMESEFLYSVMINISNASNQVKNKLRILSNAEFTDWAYSYFLERISIKFTANEFDNFVFQNSSSIFRPTEISDTGAGQDTVALKNKSLEKPNEIFCLERHDFDDIYMLNGKQISFYSKNIEKLNGKLKPTKLLTNVWTDISWEGISQEGAVTFKKGKKPEKLIQRCIQLATKEGDIVLDSFGGSGTTAAVAHKMNRKWITIELGDQAKTHITKRLKKVISGKDLSGITNDSNWQGGGGFRYLSLAASLLKKDKWGNWIINKEYNPEMLTEAMCKHMGFTYTPNEIQFWNHGYSTETDYIYVTTGSLAYEQLKVISEEVGSNRTLLICCKAFMTEGVEFDNLTLKKIPQAILNKCEWDHDDYSFTINVLDDPDTDYLDNIED